MEPTVLAGTIAFSPAEIAFIIAVLAAAAVVVSAPGWVVLSLVMSRRQGPAASTGRRWWSRVGGALLGLVLSFGVASLVVALVEGPVVGVLAAWAACWALAALVHRRGPAPDSRRTPGEGWGR